MGVTMAANDPRRVDDVLLLDGLTATMKMAELLVDLRHSIGLEVRRNPYYAATLPPNRLAEILPLYAHERLMLGRDD